MHKRTQLAGLVLVTMLLGLPTSHALGSDTPTTEAEAAQDDPVGDAARFRATFGLAADGSIIAQSFSDPDRFSNWDWGVPLSQPEATEMQRRLVVREAIVPASDYALAQGHYAGVFIDQKRGGLPIFLFSQGRPTRTGMRLKGLCRQKLSSRFSRSSGQWQTS